MTLGLVVLAATSLAVAGLIVADAWSGEKARYAIAGNLAGTALLAIAAFAPTGRLRVRARRILLPGALLAAVLFAATSYVAGLAKAPVQIAVATTLLVAAVGLARRANRRDEPLLRWIAVAVVLGAFAKVDYALIPPIGAQAVHLGDVLRIMGWVALSVGVVGELRTRMRVRAETAVALERRRLARELHDGVAQELAFIRRRAGRLSESADGLEILGAADRALEDSRRAIEALVPPAHERLDVALERLGARLATECGVEVQVNVREAADVSDEVRAELVRIISEATRNAAHHGGARHVRVDLTAAPLAVRIIDDGSGFRDGANSGLGVAGYGLIAMRERAELVGGQFSLESVRGAGTLVQVVLP
ncbi:histidine kinase [Solirubrobacter phytolaccae]|uniref:histidine kinase n=1 Tax=Solirubrobacter phytolaccae TaxID=1404360 RepID=A0A9X3S9X0_9ACTN|nr:ATP-binding protein [Solirubrobacter phytolaccae]MDA0181956.1 histidine kinase [Solirubrobacter phytolaccae]